MTGIDLSALNPDDDSLGDLLFSILPASTQACLRRCAVPPTFDADMFKAELRGTAGPELATLVAAGQVDPCEADGERYVITPMLRTPALTRWWTETERPAALVQPVPAGLSELAGRLLIRLQDADRALERLDLAVLANPATGADVFRELYDAADLAHDLSMCRALLDILDAPERRPLLDTTLGRLRNEAALRLSARSMWTTAFYESARYVQRTSLEEPLEKLLEGKPSRVLQLHADGGMGKTMQVRWLIARRCARRGEETACVRIDFDVVDPITASRLPWLLLVEIASQLDPQLSGAPFQEFLASYGPYRALLNRVDVAAADPVALTAPSADDGTEVVARFLDVLHELPGQRMLLVLDTMEEVLGSGVNSDGIFEQVAALLAAAPAARVLFAGRWDLTNRVARIGDLLPELQSAKVPVLSEAEQREYLTEVRKLEDPEIVTEIIRLSEGYPITVAQYANMVKRSDSVTAEVLSSFGEPGLVFALERVVERIQSDQLQWLIRYGVVPRMLSFSFANTVLPGYLREGMSGTSTLDDPERDSRPQDRTRKIFRTGVEPPVGEADMTRLWNRLLTYAEDYGWVSVTSEDRLVVAFRPDVLAALRGLLRDHPIYLELHRKAAEFYEQDNHVRMRCEAIYHWFQLDHDTGAAAWRRAIAQARTRGADQICLQLATDLLGRDYVDWEGSPRNGFSYQMIAEAQLERARAAAALAEREHGRVHPLWSEVEAGLNFAARLVPRDDVVLPTSDLTVLRARLLTAQGRASEAGPLLSQQPKDLSVREQADAERARGQSLANSDPASASHHFTTAYELALQAEDTQTARSSALWLAHTENVRARFDSALAAIDRAQGDGVVDVADFEASISRAWSLFYAGRPATAARTVETLLVQHPSASPQGYISLGWLHLLGGDHQGAISACESALAGMSERSHAPEYGEEMATAVRGIALSKLFAIPRGLDDLLSASARARDLMNFEDAAFYNSFAANALIDVVGDLREAQQCLEEARQLNPPEGGTSWLYVEIAYSRLAARIGRHSKAKRLTDQILTRLNEERVSPGHRVAGLMAALAAADSSEVDGLLGQLTETVRSVSPPSAWLEALSEIYYLPHLSAMNSPALAQLIDLAQESVADRSVTLDPADEERRWWLLGEVLRVAGRRQDAIATIEQARSASTSLLAWWYWLEAMDRIGIVSEHESVPPDDGLDGLERSPLLVAAYRISLAERRLLVDSVADAEARLRPVAHLLSSVGRLTTWTARHFLLRARLARRSQSEGEAQHRAADAVRIFSRLGDSVAREDVAREFELGSHVSHDDVGTIEVALAVSNSHVEVNNGQSADSQPFSLARSELLLDPPGGRSDPRSSLRIGQGWWEWAGRVGRQILPENLRDELVSAHPHGLDLRIVPRAAELAALPWELLRLDGDSVHTLTQTEGIGTLYRSLPASPREEARTRALQIALSRLQFLNAVPDGYMGGRTRDALAAFQDSTGLPTSGKADPATWMALNHALTDEWPTRPLRVLLLRPSPNNELQRQRDAAASGRDPAAVYRQHRVRIDVVEDPTLDKVWKYSRTRGRAGVDILHICGTPRTARGSTVLDFGGKVSTRSSYWASRSEGLSVTAVSELLSALTPDILTPSVIVDVPQPHTSAETTRALLARNVFAYQLLRLGRVPGVLATGLAWPDQQDELLDAIVGELASGGSLAGAARKVWRRRTARADELRDSLSFLTTALFLQRPPATMLPITLA